MRPPVEFECVGHGQPVMLIHGSMSSKNHWKPLMDALKDRYTVMAVDLTGYGQTGFPPDPETHTLWDEVGMLRQTVLTTKAIATPFHIVAHSYGGAVALGYACRYPHEIASLILYEPMAMHLLVEFNRRRQFADGQGLIDRISALVTQGDSHMAAQTFVDYFSGDGSFSMLTPGARDNLKRYVHKMLVDYRTAVETDLCMADYARIACPVCLITGRSSDPLPLAISRLMIDAIASIQWIEVPGHHMAPVSSPQVVNPVIVECLRRHTQALHSTKSS
jgi:pimeloyl-ACP methyl ester carboxylesterase